MGTESDNNNFDEHILPTAEEMRALDLACIESGTASIELMERAGQGICKFLQALPNNIKEKSLLVLSGPGNNGGDGLVVARVLFQAGFKVKVLLVCDSHISADNSTNASRFSKECKQEIYIFGKILKLESLETQLEYLTQAEVKELLFEAEIVIDALLGYGQNAAPRGSIAIILGLLNMISAGKIKIAVDVPSGIDASSGQVFEPHFKADHTLAIQYIKRGCLQYPARKICGQIKCIPIGIPGSATIKFKKLTRASLPVVNRRPDIHKGSNGRVVVIGSEEGMPGATVLASHAALRVGAGLVTRVTPGGSKNFCITWPEVMHKTIGTQVNFCPQEFSNLEQIIDSATVVIVGPGLTTQADTCKFVAKILKKISCPAVIDAGALTALIPTNLTTFSLHLKDNWILTPHPGEFARLANISTEQVQKDRYLAYTMFTDGNPSILVLKGASTIVGNKSNAFVNITGNAAMATAGMGDVLTGIIAGFVAQGLSPLESAKLGVYLHGLTADILIERQQAPLIASDIINCLPEVLAQGFFQLEI